MKKKLYFILLIIILVSCNSKENKDKDAIYDSIIASKFGSNFKANIYSAANDTVLSWSVKELLIDSVISNSGKQLIWEYQLDSTICVNSNGNKLIGTLHQFGFCQDPIECDELIEFFGAKINSKWYFWKGGGMGVGRTSFKNHDPKKPLSYAQLHKAAMENFLGGYLTKDGEINDKWFESKFKDGYTPFEQRYKYKYILDGQRIDNEKQYYEYLWKRKGLILWITKLSKDSIAEVNNLGGEKLSRDQENEIRMAISRKMLAQ